MKILKILFRGTHNFLFYYKKKIPLKFFWMWLYERWKYDLNVVLMIPLILPYTILITLSQFFEWLSECINQYVPNKIKPSLTGMQNVVMKTREWEKKNK